MEDINVVTGKKLLGIKLLCIFLLLSGIGLLLSFFLNPASLLNVPNEEKLKMIQSEPYKHLNITTVEQFDKHVFDSYVKPISKMKPFMLFEGIVSLILAIGLWGLKKWVYIGVIIYTIFSVTINLLWTPLRNAINLIPGSLIAVIIIYYLTRPKVKEQFK